MEHLGQARPRSHSQMPTYPLIPKRGATALHDYNVDTLNEGLKFIKRCQKRAISKRFNVFLDDMGHTYRRCLLYEEMAKESGPGACHPEKFKENEGRKRKLHASELMLESRADHLNQVNQQLVDVLRDLFELELLTKYGDYFGVFWNDMRAKNRASALDVLHHKFVTDVVAQLDSEARALQQWTRDQSAQRPDQEYSSQVSTLACEMGIDKTELMFRLRVYASRNTLAHSGNLNADIERCHFGAVAATLVADFHRLEEVLLKADRASERAHWEDALKKFASLYFVDFEFEDPEFVLTESARERQLLRKKERQNARENAKAKAAAEAELLSKQEQGKKKERRNRIRESSAEFQINAANLMDNFFEANPGHELEAAYKQQKRHYAKIESEQVGKELWKDRAEDALLLLEDSEQCRLDWDVVADRAEKVREAEESLPVDFEAMGF